MSPNSDKILESISKQVKNTLWQLCEAYGVEDVADWAMVPKSMMEKYRQLNSDRFLPVENLVILSRYINDNYQDNALLELLKGSSVTLWATCEGFADGSLEDNHAKMVQIMAALSVAKKSNDRRKYKEVMEQMKTEVNNYEKEGLQL